MGLGLVEGVNFGATEVELFGTLTIVEVTWTWVTNVTLMRFMAHKLGSHAGPWYPGWSFGLRYAYELSRVIIHRSSSSSKYSCKWVTTCEVWFLRPWFETLWGWRQGWVTVLCPKCNQSIQKQHNDWQSIHSLPETQSCPPDEPSLLQHLCHRGFNAVLEALRRDLNLDSAKGISQRRISF